MNEERYCKLLEINKVCERLFAFGNVANVCSFKKWQYCKLGKIRLFGIHFGPSWILKRIETTQKSVIWIVKQNKSKWKFWYDSPQNTNNVKYCWIKVIKVFGSDWKSQINVKKIMVNVTNWNFWKKTPKWPQMAFIPLFNINLL